MSKTPAEREPLIDSYIRKLKPPAKSNKVHYDPYTPGFGVRVTAAGKKAFVLNYRTRAGRERRYTIGSFADWQTTGARAEAKRLRRLIDEGGDPLADIEAEREAPTMDDLCTRFEDEHLPDTRPGTAADYRRILNNHIRPAFGEHIKVADVTSDHIKALHRKITKTGHLRRANTVVAVLSKMFSLAQNWAMTDTNPCRGIKKNHETKRKRYMDGDELARLTKALAAHPDKQAANIIRLLLLTGCRRGEALSARWANLDLGKGVWSKPASSTKQKEDHVVPLSAPARQLLSEIRDEQTAKKRELGKFVFPSDSKSGHVVELKRAWRTLCKSAGITGLRVHDLRHSFASQLASSGASLPLIGALLGHSNPATTHRYTHLFIDPQRRAVETVGAIIGAAGMSALPPEPAKIKRGR
jgi:integrase